MDRESTISLVLRGIFGGLIVSAFVAVMLNASSAEKMTPFKASHAKVLVRVNYPSGMQFIHVDERDAEKLAAAYRHQGLYAEVQYPQEQQ